MKDHANKRQLSPLKMVMMADLPKAQVIELFSFLFWHKIVNQRIVQVYVTHQYILGFSHRSALEHAF